MNEFRSIAFRIILLGIPCLFVVILAFTLEAILKYKSEKAGVFFKFNNERVISLRENTPGFTYLEPSEQKGKWIITGADINGFLLPKTKNKKPDLTIAFLGGSTTHVVSVALKDRFPYLVGRLLEERLGKKVHSLNAAAPGSHKHHSINVLFNKVLPKNPDYVVIMHAINDLNILLLSNDYWNPTSLRYSIQRKFTLGNAFRYFKNEYFPYTYNAIVPQLHKFQLWRNIWKRALGGRVEGALGEKVDEWAKYRGKKAFFDEEHIKKKFKSAQLTAIRIAQSWGAIHEKA